MPTVDARPAKLDIVCAAGDDLSVTLTTTTTTWLNGYTLTAPVTTKAGASTGVTFTTSWSSGTLTLGLTDTDTLTTLGVGTFNWRLSGTSGSTTTTFLAGELRLTAQSSGSGTTSLSASVTVTSQTVSLSTTQLVAPNASAISVTDTGGRFAATNVETALAELNLVYNVKSYGAVGDGTTDDTTAIQNAINACQTAGGGVVFLPVGTYKITTTLTVTGATQTDGFDAGGVTIRGESQRGSKLKVIGGITGIKFPVATTRMMCHLEDFEMVGPGSSTASSRGTFWEGPGGAYFFRNLYIHDFEVGSEWYDSTLGTSVNCNWRLNSIGVRTGYNVDIHTFIGCRMDANATGIYVGVTDAVHTTPVQNENALQFIGCRISGNSARAFFINDRTAVGIRFEGCYFESNVKEGEVGVNGRGDTVGVVGLSFESCFFTPVLTFGQAVGIDVFNRTTMEFRNCSTDGTSRYVIFVKLNDEGQPSRCLMTNCSIVASTATIQYGGRNYLDTNTYQERLEVGAMGVIESNAGGSLPASGIWKVHSLANGTGKVWDSWTRLNSSTGATLAEMQLYDTGGVMRFGGVGSTPGYVCATSVTGLPTATSNYRGALAFVAGGAGVADTFYICLKSAADTYSWKSIVVG